MRPSDFAFRPFSIMIAYHISTVKISKQLIVAKHQAMFSLIRESCSLTAQAYMAAWHQPKLKVEVFSLFTVHISSL